MTIPLFKPSCTDAEVAAVTRVLRSGWWGMGAEVEAFEEEFASYVGQHHAIAVNSGTAALELAARALCPESRTFIVPALTFVSSAMALQHAGHKVVFADIHEDTLTINWSHAEQLAEEIYLETGKHAGVLPVWYGGTVTNVPWGFTQNRVLEDCAHAAGSQRAGLYGHAAAWSFHAVKNLATGDGGMITTNDPVVAKDLRRLRWLGIDRSTWDRDKDARVGYGWDYNITQDGEKAHMNDLTAALGRVQLKRLNEMNAVRFGIADIYNDQLYYLNHTWIDLPPLNPAGSNHLYVVRVSEKVRPRFIEHMISNGVSAGVHYKPLTEYPDLFDWCSPRLPVTDRVWKTLVTLPLYPDMEIEDTLKVANTIRSFKP